MDEAVEHYRKHEKGERVVSEGLEEVAVEQMVEHAGGAAAGAIEAGELEDGAGRQPDGLSGSGEEYGGKDNEDADEGGAGEGAVCCREVQGVPSEFITRSQGCGFSRSTLHNGRDFGGGGFGWEKGSSGCGMCSLAGSFPFALFRVRMTARRGRGWVSGSVGCGWVG